MILEKTSKLTWKHNCSQTSMWTLTLWRQLWRWMGIFLVVHTSQTSILDLQSSMNITYVMILDRMWWFWRLDVNFDDSQSNVMFIDVLWWVFNTTRAEIKGSWLVLNPENREKSLLLENIKVDIQSSMNITFHLKSSRLESKRDDFKSNVMLVDVLWWFFAQQNFKFKDFILC